MKASNILKLFAVVGVLGMVYASANNLSITPSSTALGSGSTAVAAACGSVTSVTYNLQADDAAKLESVTFGTTADVCDGGAATVTVYDGATPIVTATCTVTSDACTANFASNPDVESVTSTSITILGGGA